LISSTSTKDEVCGASVGGRVLQTRGVTLSAPNCTVSLIGISRCEMRPVTLSSAAKMAIGFWTFSAFAGVAPSALIPAMTSKGRAMRAWRSRASECCIMPPTF
jgi:hypothetical protein